MADITREELARAVDGMAITVDLIGGSMPPGAWTAAKLRYPDSFASEVFTRILAGRDDVRAEHAAGYSKRLDRQFVINGDDLRIALSGTDGRPPLVPNPRDVAAYIVGTIGKPLGAEPEDRGDLVDAHICCEHAGTADPELTAMAAILAAMVPLDSLSIRRVMRWAWSRYLHDEPPF